MNKFTKIALVIFLIFAFTNPNLEDHKAAIVSKAMKMIETESELSGWQKLGFELGRGIGSVLLEQHIERDNYIIFSLGKIFSNQESKIFSIGFLGNVFVMDLRY